MVIIKKWLAKKTHRKNSAGASEIFKFNANKNSKFDTIRIDVSKNAPNNSCNETHMETEK